MEIYSLTALINAITSFVLGVFVYFKNKQAPINKTFALFALAVFFWSFSYFLWQIAKDPQSALFWSRSLIFGAIFIPIFYFHFVIYFLEIFREKKRILVFGYILALIFFFLNFTSLMVKGVTPKLFFSYWPEPGMVFSLFLLMFFGYVIYSWYLMFRAYEKLTGIKREQVKYVLIGTFIGFFGGSTNYFLWYNIPVLPLGNGLVAVYVALVAVAIVKYRLMNIRVILTESLVILIAFVLLAETVSSKTFYELLFRGGLFLIFCVIGYLLIKSVLNEIKRREQLEKLTIELEKTYKKLKIVSQAKSEFVSIASHQLRTPLTAIKGYISMIIEGTYGKLSSEMVKPLENVYESNEKLISLVNDLLNLSRLEAGKIEFEPTLTSLEKMISEIIEELRINADKKGLYIKLTKPKKPLPEIMVDRAKLRQVVLNIIDNAIKYTNRGGITVELKIVPTLSRIPDEIGKNSKLEIAIKDTGAGIAKEEIKSLFRMFSRAAAGTKLHTGGAGVGLHVAKKFIEMHHGRIWAESLGERKGSTFYIELPIKT